MPDVIDRINKMIAEKFRLDASTVNGQIHFERDLRANGYDVSELLIDIEKEFNITIADDEAENIQTVGQVLGFVEAKIPAHV